MLTIFIGVIGSGKNYRQERLARGGAVPLDFKDTLIAMCSTLVGYDVRDNYDGFKENLLGLTAPGAPAHKCMARGPAAALTRQVLSDYPAAMTGRRLLQRLGTEVMRKRDPEYWVKEWCRAAEKLILQGRDIACADARFINEVRAAQFTAEAHKVEVKFVFCDYKSARYDAAGTHESEKLAQALLRAGCTDGQELTAQFILQV
jgi:hypothetical protein